MSQAASTGHLQDREDSRFRVEGMGFTMLRVLKF